MIIIGANKTVDDTCRMEIGGKTYNIYKLRVKP